MPGLDAPNDGTEPARTEAGVGIGGAPPMGGAEIGRGAVRGIAIGDVVIGFGAA